MKRGEIWTVSGGKDYAGKPRPAVVVRNDAFDNPSSVTVCGFTSAAIEASQLRLPVDASLENGLRDASNLMIDKIMTVPMSKIGARIGRLDAADMARLDGALLVYLGLAGGPE